MITVNKKAIGSSIKHAPIAFIQDKQYYWQQACCCRVAGGIYGKKYNSISNLGLWWLSPPPRMDLFQH